MRKRGKEREKEKKRGREREGEREEELESGRKTKLETRPSEPFLHPLVFAHPQPLLR